MEKTTKTEIVKDGLTTEQITQELIKGLQQTSLSIDATQKEKTQKDFILSLSKEDFKSSFLGNPHIKKVSYNNETNKEPLKVTLYNGFIFGCMSEVYNADFNTIRNALNTTSEYIALNRMVSSEINKNAQVFLNRL